MGNCGSTEEGQLGYSAVGSHPNSPQDEEVSKSIDKQIRLDEKRLSREHKLLLLGAGESGKTTILKQMKIIHQNGFTPQEVEYYRRQIFDNLCYGVRLVLDALDDWMVDVSPENKKYLPLFVEANPMIQDNEPFPQKYHEAISSLWMDKNIQRVLTRANEAAIPENLQYFFPDLDRLFRPEYTPSLQDILHARGKTTGISETVFDNKNFVYRLFDVGGQRSERKKWIHCFENVTAVIFLAALPGYDQCLLEDTDSNVMQEALMLFDSICNSKWFARTSIILFLNKIDLFKEKIVVSDITRFFPEYQGPSNDYHAARDFFQRKFLALNRSKEKEIYTHYTCAVDTKAVRVVMASVADIVLSSNLDQIMF